MWADAVGGERGELVVIQCDLARGGLSPAEAGARRRRERELLARNHTTWSGVGFASPHKFRRGFVESIGYSASELVDPGRDVARNVPLLRSLGVDFRYEYGDPLLALQQVIEWPGYPRLRGLLLTGQCYQVGEVNESGFAGRGDEAAQMLVAAGALTRLRGLGFYASGITVTGVRHLAASGALAHLDKLVLHEWPLSSDAARVALAHAPQVKSLDLTGDIEAFAPILPPVATLCVSDITDEALAALGRSHAAPTLERLRLLGGQLEHGDGFRAFARLRSLHLELGPSRFGDLEHEEGVRGLAAALPALRYLRLPLHSPAHSARAVARQFGPQLEVLEVVTWENPDLAKELQTYVAGDVHLHSSTFYQPVL